MLHQEQTDKNRPAKKSTRIRRAIMWGKWGASQVVCSQVASLHPMGYANNALQSYLFLVLPNILSIHDWGENVKGNQDIRTFWSEVSKKKNKRAKFYKQAEK